MAASPSTSSQLPPLSLDAIVNHFVASKRSLAAIEHVYRANAIVDTARTALEAVATLAARSAYLRRGVAAQQGRLDAIRTALQKVADAGQDEFRATLASLDAADAAVKDVLATLRSTAIEPSLQPAAAGEPRTLHSFVDEHGIDELGAEFRACIDRTNEAQDQLDDSNGRLDDEMAAISRRVDDTLEGDTDPRAAVATLFRALEEHAAEMAALLSSLVQHYDLCTQALKHTEGGGEAAQHATQVELPRGIDVELLPNPLPPPQQPISAEERTQMLRVLETDAAEVDDVVHEIRERVAEMELQGERMAALLATMRARHDALLAATSLLDQLGARLPVYVDAGASFVHKWRDLRLRIEEKMDEMHGLRHFYAGFLRAYDGLLVEIVRRKVTRSRVQKVAQDALRKIKELTDDDAEERDAFTEEHGDFLPADIWPGLAHAAPKFELRPLDGAEHPIPDIPKEAWQKATDRLRRSRL